MRKHQRVYDITERDALKRVCKRKPKAIWVRTQQGIVYLLDPVWVPPSDPRGPGLYGRVECTPMYTATAYSYHE